MGGCETSISKEDLDRWYDYFLWSLNIIEENAYNAISWEVNRIDLFNVISLTDDGTYVYVSWDTICNTLNDQLDFNLYDNVFVFWPDATDDCNIPSPYFGLAWWPWHDYGYSPGFVNVKSSSLDSNTVEETINYLKTSDPGVWVHEWLHTVADKFYPDLGYSLPSTPGNGVVHSAEEFNYTEPWMIWYKDIIQGKVSSKEGNQKLGIGPEALWTRSIRD